VQQRATDHGVVLRRGLERFLVEPQRLAPALRQRLVRSELDLPEDVIVEGRHEEAPVHDPAQPALNLGGQL
jgi:hypothetical protein